MQTIIFLKDAEGFLRGDVKILPNNDAHRLVFNRAAKLYNYADKMMSAKQRKGKKGYKVK